MSEFDLPITLTFKNLEDAYDMMKALDRATEQVLWENRVAEDGSMIVRILNIINLEERKEAEDGE